MVENRFKMPVTVHIALRREGKYLLALRRSGAISPGAWRMVSGHLDGGETVCEAAAREIKEETGIDVLPENIEVRSVRHSTNPEYEHVMFVAMCDKWEGEPVITEPEVVERYDFFPPDELPENTATFIKHAVEMVNSDVRFYEDATSASHS